MISMIIFLLFLSDHSQCASPPPLWCVECLDWDLASLTPIYTGFLENPDILGKIIIFPFSRGPSSLWEEKKERLALAKRYASRPFGDFGLGNWELEPRRPHHRPGNSGVGLVAILPPPYHHPPPAWTHIPWIDQRAHFEGSDEVWRGEEQEERKVRKRGSREGRLRRKGAKGESTELSDGEAVRRSVSLHSRAGRERRQKVTSKII